MKCQINKLIQKTSHTFQITLGTGVRNELLGTLNKTGGLSSPNNTATNYATVTAIRWFSAELVEEGIRLMQAQRRNLAVAQQNGQVHLLRSEVDEEPMLLETRLQEITSVEWNCTGNVLAVGGVILTSASQNHSRLPADGIISNAAETTSSSRKLVILFYSPENGQMLHRLSVPGTDLVACSWERYGLRIAIAVDNFVYFANVRPDHLWTHFADTFAYALPNSRQLYTLLFCQLRSGKYSAKTVSGLTNVQSCGQYCVLATDQEMQSEADHDLMSETFQQQNTEMEMEGKMRSSLFICNSIGKFDIELSFGSERVSNQFLYFTGTSVDTVNVEFKINHLAMNNARVFAAGTDSFCIWRFRSPWKNAGLGFGPTPDLNDVSSFYGDSLDPDQVEEGDSNGAGFDRLFNVTLSRTDAINCICCSDKLLIVGQKSGTVQVYQLPRAVLSQRLQLGNLLWMKLNSESTRLATLDTNREMRILDLEQNPPATMAQVPTKDVWDFCWSSDNGQWLGYIQRGKLYVLDLTTLTMSRPRLSSNASENKQNQPLPALGATLGYICSVANLQVTIVLLDHLLLQLQQLVTGVLALNVGTTANSDRLHPADFIQRYDSDLLKQARQQFEKQSLAEVASFIEQHSHPRLWRLLADSALHRLQLPAAELGFVRERDLHGVQFVKRLAQLADDRWRRAEVQLYFGKPEETESIYLAGGRADLALEMWRMMGNWTRVWQLLQEQGSVDQRRLDEARAGLAAELQEQGDFVGAATHYASLGDLRQLIHCCVLGHQFDRLVATVRVALQNARLTQIQELVGSSDQDHKFYTNLSEGFDDTISWPDDHSGWSELGDLMQSLGECELAAQCFLAADRPQAAIDCCVKLNQWNLAIRLATQQRGDRVKQLLAGYASQLAKKKRWLDVMQLYAQANQQTAAWKVLISIAERARQSNWSPWIMKKLYVLAGLLATGCSNTGAVAQRDMDKSSNNQIRKKLSDKADGYQQVDSHLRSSLASANNASTKLQALLDENDVQEEKDQEEDQLQMLREIRRTSTSSLDLASSRKETGRQDSIESDLKSESDINQDLLSCLSEMELSDYRPNVSSDDQQAVREMQLKRLPWKGAEAYHFFLLTQSQLQEGYVDAAMNTALLLMDYEQFLSPLRIYTLIALTAAANRNLAVCSRAFIRLEALEQESLDALLMQDDQMKDNSDEFNETYMSSSELLRKGFKGQIGRGRFAALAVQLFSRRPPKSHGASSGIYECPLCEAPLTGSANHRCSKCESSFSICVASGRPILEHGQSWTCAVCRHQAIRSDLVGYSCCPLCHHQMENK